MKATISQYHDPEINEEEGLGQPVSRSEVLVAMLRSLPEQEFKKVCEDLMVITISSDETQTLSREELLSGPFRAKIERWERLGLENHIVDLIEVVERTKALAKDITGDGVISQEELPGFVHKHIIHCLCFSI